jgi:hypothetical protein
MRRGFLIGFTAAGLCATLAVTGVVLLRGDARAADSVAKGGRYGQAGLVVGAQPDTTSPDWKELSADVGVMIRDDERLGLRGRLYVRAGGLWYPVATDGPADVHPTVPVK